MTVMYLTAGAYADENAPKDKAHCSRFPEKATQASSETFPLTALVLDD